MDRAQPIPFETPIIGYPYPSQWKPLIEAADRFFDTGLRAARVVAWSANPNQRVAVINHSFNDEKIAKAVYCLLAGGGFAFLAYQAALHGCRFIVIASLGTCAAAPLLLVVAALVVKITARHFYSVMRASEMEENIDSLQQLERRDLTNRLEGGLTVPPTAVDQLAYIVSNLVLTEDKIKPSAFHTQAAEGFLSGPLQGKRVRWLNANVLQLEDTPDLIFKLGNIELIWQRFHNGLKALECIESNQLNRLIIPHTKLVELTINGRRTFIIAEQRLNINMNHSQQEARYYAFSQSPESIEAVRHLTKFILKTRQEDVEQRNFPLLKHRDVFALVDIERTTIFPSTIGIFGRKREEMHWEDPSKYQPKYYRTGLFRCLFSKQHLDIARSVCIEEYPRFNQAVADRVIGERLQEIAQYETLQLFYAHQGISANPNQAIDGVNCDTLIDPNTIVGTNGQGHPIRLSNWPDVCRMYIGLMNKAISQSSPADTANKRRYIKFDIDQANKEHLIYLPIIAKALIAQRKIFAIADIYAYSICLQA